MKHRILDADFSRSLEAARDHVSQCYVAEVANSNAWVKFRDINALDYGVDGTRASLVILRILCATIFSDRQCPMDSCECILPEGTPLCDHLLNHYVFSQPGAVVITLSKLTTLIISIASD